jgi:hypothetical protein
MYSGHSIVLIHVLKLVSQAVGQISPLFWICSIVSAKSYIDQNRHVIGQ